MKISNCFLDCVTCADWTRWTESSADKHR